MKLQTKINYRFLALLLIVFILSGGILYHLLGWVVSDNLDEMLEKRSEKVKQNIFKYTETSFITGFTDQFVKVKPTLKSQIPITYSDTIIFDNGEREFLNYRKINFGAISQGKSYEITIMISKLETEDLVEIIFYFLLGLFALIVLILFFLNRYLSSSAWKPFYKTIEQLEIFKIGQKNEVHFDKTKIYEFDKLNTSLWMMVKKSQSDFNNLKEFTENASHEIQTPIAIIQSRLESVLQDKDLPIERYIQIQSAYESVSRLSKLNETLLLLSKIENQQFPDVAEINLCDLIQQRLLFIEELVSFKRIEVILKIQNPIVAKVNPYLAEILINNLLGNAVKHNIEDGQIIIASSPNLLTISNTGVPLTIEPEKLFQRFAKHNASNESTGLGLAIASEICIKSQIELQYNYKNGFHNLLIFV